MSRNVRSRRWFVLAVASVSILIAGLGLAGAVTASAGAADGTPDAKLLQTYQPVLVFHPNELFRPTKIQSFVEDSELERFVGTNPAQLPLDPYWVVVDSDPEPGDLPPVTPGAFFRLDQIACEADSTLAGSACYAAAWREGSGGDAVYGRVVRTSTRIVLQYWLFYYDNPLILPAPLAGFWQSHEGDWEVVNVVLGADESPLEAAYSQHCTGQKRAWSAVTKSPAGSTHPVAYVALGSHANYFGTGVGPLGLAQIASSCIPPAVPSQYRPYVFDQVLDGSSAGAVVGPPGSGVDAATIHRIEGMDWASFGGRWGESEYLFTPVAIPPVPANTAVPFGLAPASPANQPNWNASTVLAW
jgi:hypothetical protein